MANLREILAGDITGSSLKASPIREVPIDRIYALGSTNPLGACLWRLKYAYDVSAYRRTLTLMSLRAMGYAPKMAVRWAFCKTVLHEWLDEKCRACGGRRFIVASESSATHICTTCDGTGLRRYSDQWRMRQMGLDQKGYRSWERKFTGMHQKIADADRQTWRDVALELGWLDDDEKKYLARYEIRSTLLAANAGGSGAQLDYMPTPSCQ